MRLTEQVHLLLEKNLGPGDHALDATAGNGFDTLKMAECVGPNGHIVAVDLQESAINATRSRLSAAGRLSNVDLICGNHADVLLELVPTRPEAFAAITFNLGYLPGSDKSIQTEPESTLGALATATLLLKPCGWLLVTAYRGHSGGMEEAEAVATMMNHSKRLGWTVDSQIPPAQGPRLPPVLWTARKPG